MQRIEVREVEGWEEGGSTKANCPGLHHCLNPALQLPPVFYKRTSFDHIDTNLSYSVYRSFKVIRCSTLLCLCMYMQLNGRGIHA